MRKLVKPLLLGWLVAYPVLSWFSVLGYQKGYFKNGVNPPFFTWKLMTDVNRSLDYLDIEVCRLGSKSFDPCLGFLENRNVLGGRKPQLMSAVYKLSVALNGKNSAEAGASIHEISSMFGGSIDFKLVHIQITSRGLYRGDPFQTHEEIGRFNAP